MNAPLKAVPPGNLRREIGKIQKVYFGFGGYQDVQIGLFLVLGSDKESWGVHTGIEGGWSTKVDCSEHCKWTETDRDGQYATMVRKIQDVLKAAKVESVDQLLGKPIEAMFKDFNTLHDWRILEEVL
jgi:hypothetical protein